ncbi:rolling circle replication-associated protein [Clostridium sp. LP20]|uniref:rolling circle replication-associated protein n=1 Tax=Clostridium sp. LP20 TaxID=3418665 RepID=UPI003EE74A74
MERLYNLKIITSGDRLEIYKMNNYAARTNFKRDLKAKEIILNEEKGKIQSQKDRKATLNKARNNIMRLIKANPDMTTFITLTFSRVPNYKESKRLLNIFFTKLRKEHDGLKYIWVLELGEKYKRLHYHLLTNLPIGVKLSSNFEEKTENHKRFEELFRQEYWDHGFIDIRNLKQEDNTNIALYVSAYIVKSLIDVKVDGRVYSYSHKTMNRPIETKVYSNDNLEQLLSKFDDYDLIFSNSYNIGFTDWKGERKGTVTYLDLNKKGE